MTEALRDLAIRVETLEDVDVIGEVVAAGFGSPVEARLVVALRASDAFIPELLLVAEHDGRILGHVMITRVTLDDEGSECSVATLSPLAVAPDAQRTGIGSALVREVTARADRRGEPLVVLEGSPDYYGRFGFEHSVLHGIHITTLPWWAPPEAAQVLRLSSYDPALQGRIVYPPLWDEFMEHEPPNGRIG